MFVYVGRNFTAALSGSVVRDVTCEKCGCAYHYQLTRRGQGSGTAPYYINQGGAQRRAERGAKKSLEKQLARDTDPVPCPDCGWFQSPMVREIRRRSMRWLNWTALTLGIFGTIVLAGFVGNATRGFDRDLEGDDRTVAIIMAAVLVAVIVGPLLLRLFILRARDPNKDYPDRPAPIPGAPKPWKDGEDAVAAPPPLAFDAGDAGALTYQRIPPEVEPGGWVTVQLLEMPMPAECCACLMPTHEVMAFKKGELVQVPLKLCRPCQAVYRRRRRAWMLWTVPVCAGAAFLFTLMPDVAKEFGAAGAYIFIGIMALVGLLLGAVLGNTFAPPARLGRFDGRLNTLRIRFKNREYVPVFAAAVSAMPARPPQAFEIPIPRHVRA